MRGLPLAPGTRRGWFRALGVACLLAVAAPARAATVEAYLGRTVTEVEVVSDGRVVGDPVVRELVETRVGEPLSMRQVRESLTHLFSLGRYAGAAVAAREHPGGVALRYELRPFEVVERLQLDGRRVLPDGALRDVVADRHGESFPTAAAADVVETLRDYYAQRGFFAPRLTHALRGDSTRRTLLVTIEAGPRARVARWLITGVSPVLYQSIRTRLGLVDGVPYDGAEIDRRLGAYEGELRQLRYYQARLAHSVERRSETAVDVRLTISRGPRITVQFAGDEVPDVDLGELVPVAREASVDEDLLEDADRRIAAELRGRGYRDAAVTHTRTGDADELSVVFTVTRGPLYRLDDLVIEGHASVSTEEIRALVDVAPGDPLVAAELDAALGAIEAYYGRLGFATVRAARSSRAAAAPGVAGEIAETVAIEIVEGARTTVGAVAFEGGDAWPRDVLEATISARVGGPFYAPQVRADRNALLTLYLNEGFEQARVAVVPEFADDLSTVVLVFRIDAGPQVRVEHVIIIGNRAVDSATIRRELALAPEAPLGLDDVAETRRRLNALGMFRRLDIREFSHGRADQRDVIIEVEEAPATRLAYGGGMEVSQRLRRETNDARSQAVERIELAPRASFEIGRRHLWGRNRSIDLFTRVSVRRKNDVAEPGLAESMRAFGFNEYRVLGTYREPRSFGLGWDVLVSGYVEQAIRPGFDLASRGVTAQLTRQTGPTAGTTVGYRLGNNDTSNKQLNREDEDIVDRLFPNVRLSAFTASRLRDTRDDPFEPTGGSFVSVETDLAARAIGSAVGFSRSFVSGSVYRRLPGSERVVLAAGARVGLAWGFPQLLDVELATTGCRSRPSGEPAPPASLSLTDPALPISERFFAGGDTTVRGFALDRLGSPCIQTGGTIDQDGFPQGGNALLIFNTELRVRLTRVLGLVTFLDAGNVYDRVQHMSLRHIRSGAGFGVRYSSPVGPIRVDLGFKLGERHIFGDQTSRTQEPLTALHISIGQAF